MKWIDRRKSLEPCTESGWDAIDVILAEGLTDQDILELGRIGGSFLYMKQLRRPFFKLESHEYVIKGIRGDAFFRVAAYRDRMEEIMEKVLSVADR